MNNLIYQWTEFALDLPSTMFVKKIFKRSYRVFAGYITTTAVKHHIGTICIFEDRFNFIILFPNVRNL